MQWYGCDKCGNRVREDARDFLTLRVDYDNPLGSGIGIRDAALRHNTIDLCVPCTELFKEWLRTPSAT